MFVEFIVLGIVVCVCLGVVAYNCVNAEENPEGRRINSPNIIINNTPPVSRTLCVAEEKSVLRRYGRIGDLCAICFDKLGKEDFQVLECQHALIQYCYAIWKSIRQDCPYCERKIK